MAKTAVAERNQTNPTGKAGAKYLALTEELRRDIMAGVYPVGSKLPSVVALSKKHRVSSATAHRSIRRLAREQLVACHSSPRGTIVMRTEAPARTFQRTTLACLLRPFAPQRNAVDNFGLEIIQGIQDEAARRHYRVLVHGLKEEQYDEKVMALAKDGWVAGVVLDQHTPLSFMRRLAERKVPMALFNRSENVAGLSAVSPDYERIGRDTARLLLQRGCKRFAFYPETPEGKEWAETDIPQLDRRRGFLHALAEAGVRDKDVMRIVYPDIPQGAPLAPERIGLPRQRPPDWRPLGVCVRSDRHAGPLVQAISQTDLALGRDVGIVGFGDLEINRSSAHPFSTWNVDPRAIGRETVAEIVNRIENPDAPRSVVKLRARFVDRGTA